MGSILHRETCIFVFALICSFAKKCDKKFDLHVDKIILSESSEKNGAVFLKKIVPQSSEECYKTCCESDQCTAAVYTSKRGKECYLFNCGDPNVCNFTSHADYSVFVLQQPIKHPARTSDSATTALSSATNSQPKGWFFLFLYSPPLRTHYLSGCIFV
uniref:Low-density lipoprotein receptor-related protein 11 n=1 Tax=Schistocephalus solidus TaxID=70667 RepID=A0A0X3PNU2_SCHSO